MIIPFIATKKFITGHNIKSIDYFCVIIILGHQRMQTKYQKMSVFMIVDLNKSTPYMTSVLKKFINRGTPNEVDKEIRNSVYPHFIITEIWLATNSILDPVGNCK